MTENSNLIDIECEIRNDDPTKLAFAITDGSTTENDDGDQVEDWVWIPRSQAEINDDGTVTMPEWLALEKGFI